MLDWVVKMNFFMCQAYMISKELQHRKPYSKFPTTLLLLFLPYVG